MSTRLASRIRSRPISSAALVVCGLCLVWFVAWQAVAWSQWSLFAAESWATAAVGSAELAAGPAVASQLARFDGAPTLGVMPYEYRGRRYAVTVEIPATQLRLSRLLPTEDVFWSRGPLRSAYLRAMVAAAQSDPVVSATCVQLRQTRDSLGLNSDEYAELITRFVQQIPYGTVRPRFATPGIVLANGRAVCADKSVLLAALLVHEGYDAAVIAVDATSHAAAAIRGEGPGFLHSGYAYVETTADCYIGEVPPEFDGAGPAGAHTQIVPVGGSRRYTSDMESQFVGETLIDAKRSIITLKPYHAYVAEVTGESRVAFAALAEQHVEAVQLAGELGVSTDNPARTYELLTRSGGR